jgi:alpha-L-rhamnosidase
MEIKERWPVIMGAVAVFAGMTASAREPEAAAGAPLVIAQLRTEHGSHPLGIDARQPCLGWEMTSGTRGARQTAYRIQVAESADDLADGENLLWDTGQVDSDRSAHHAYEGPALESGQRYFWRARVWDENGRPTEWSTIAWWETGLLAPYDWQARWIEPDLEMDASAPRPAAMLRKEFMLDGGVQSARLYVTSHGLYEMYLNGQRVGDELFTPGWTSYKERLQYRAYDVTSLLEEGNNAIGAMLGDGWYRGRIGRHRDSYVYGDNVALLAQLHVTYDDGRTAIAVRTGDGWKAASGPIRMSDIYLGEKYDARLERPGWAGADFEDGDWSGVREVEHSKEILFASAAPPVRRIQALKPVALIHTPAGETVLDMGQNMVGRMRMMVKGAAGTEVTLRHAEALDKDGNFYTDNLRRASQTTSYILSGKGNETYEPHFTFHGFRYVHVSGYPGELDSSDFTGIVIHSDMEPTGHFESSHPLVNQLQHNIVWGQKGNFLDVPTDCPQRDERLGWTGDIQVFAPTASFNMDTSGFLEKWLRDLEADQLDNGSVPNVVPNVRGEGASGAAGWGDAAVIVPWEVYQAYGDERVLDTQYASMKAWVDYQAERAGANGTKYLWDGDFTYGDWLAFTSAPSGARFYPGAYTNTDLVSSAFFARSTDLLRRSAEVLGKEEDARKYGALFEQIRAAFQQAFVTASGRVVSDTQTAYLLALRFGLLTGELESEAARYLSEDVEERGHLTTGFLGTPYLAPVLSRYGDTEAAYELLLNMNYPSWLYPITMGATTIWERWDGVKPDSTFQDPGMNSLNHYAYGAIGEWLYETVAGLQAAAPGYKEILIAPRPGGGLTHARARHQSPYGLIESSWALANGRFHLDIAVPTNTRATVRLPGADAAAVMESGRPVGESDGIETVQQDGEDVMLTLAAGRYGFDYPAGTLSSAAGAGVYSAKTTIGTLLDNEAAHEVLEKHFPDMESAVLREKRADLPLRQVVRHAPRELSSETGQPDEEAMRAVDAELRQIRAPRVRAFSADSLLGELLAEAKARSILSEHLPELMNSMWLSQAMGFPLTRVHEVVPMEISAQALRAVDQALRELAAEDTQ